jgi:hypothetical protein
VFFITTAFSDPHTLFLLVLLDLKFSSTSAPPPSLQAAAAVKTKLESYQHRSLYIKSRLNLPLTETLGSSYPFPSQTNSNAPTSSASSSLVATTSLSHPTRHDSSQFPSSSAGPRSTSSQEVSLMSSRYVFLCSHLQTISLI